MTGCLFDRFLESDCALDVVGSSDFHPVRRAVLEQAAGDWQQEIAVPLGAQRATPLGDAHFQDRGIQLWRNYAR